MKKKIALLLVLVITAIGSLRSQDAYTIEQLNLGITMLNEECPIDCDDGLFIKYISLNQQTKSLDYVFLTKNEMVSVAFIRQYKDTMDDVLKSVVCDPTNEDMAMIIKTLKYYGYGLNIIFTDEAGDSVKMNFPSSEL